MSYFNTYQLRHIGPHLQMVIQQKTKRMFVSMQNLEFINMDMSGGYDQISYLVSAYVRKFLSYLGPHL